MIANHATNYAIVWLAIAVVLGSVEVLVTSFVFILAGVSALVPCVLAAIGVGFEIQVIAFASVMVLSLGLLRPQLIKRFHTHTRLPGRAEALIGEVGEVTEGFNQGIGRITVIGQDWAARGDKDFATGAKIKVVGADGIVLFVEGQS